MKPICFLDVDGVINTVRKNEDTGHSLDCEGFLIHMPRGTKERIEQLSEHFEMVWCTSWEHLANKHFTPFWELPKWPVVEWWRTARGRSYKIQGILEWLNDNAPNRPFVFIDDDADFEVSELRYWAEHDDMDVVFPQKHLVITPHYLSALDDEHIRQAIEFAESLC